MVLLDYIDCVVPDKNLGDEWKSEGSVMRGFESMCHELDLVGWTATQGNRSSISSEVVTTDQMGGSIKKDVIENLMALCREHHIAYGDKRNHIDFLKKIHFLKLINTS